CPARPAEPPQRLAAATSATICSLWPAGQITTSRSMANTPKSLIYHKKLATWKHQAILVSQIHAPLVLVLGCPTKREALLCLRNRSAPRLLRNVLSGRLLASSSHPPPRITQTLVTVQSNRVGSMGSSAVVKLVNQAPLKISRTTQWSNISKGLTNRGRHTICALLDTMSCKTDGRGA
ncbi:hypothetical protein IWX50DRAFT_706787, partial [Phyllosticta citricarpa]